MQKRQHAMVVLAVNQHMRGCRGVLEVPAVSTGGRWRTRRSI